MSDVRPIVFVVDDDVSVRESLELLIRCKGWQPETFASAQEFLDHPPASVPHCLVLDVVLQKRIAMDRTDMPIIFITGHGDVPKTANAVALFLRFRSDHWRRPIQSGCASRRI